MLIDVHPYLRVIWLPGGGWWPTCGDCSYYGWRWWIGLGPLTAFVGRAKEAGK